MNEEQLRRLDALVAHRLFGYQWKQESKTKRYLISPNFHVVVKCLRNEWTYIGYPRKDLPAYSSEGNGAIAVLDWILAQNEKIVLLRDVDPEVPVFMADNTAGPSIEIAICLRALILDGMTPEQIQEATKVK